ncbi:unnamed protein product [Acanthoscelides obtectus]|uniref:Uncharacterized protein n=1 Tax=Acanthoscelides obtectus TaxID=200917 RepID=A0A9P0LTN5_ACAOB|nr:unnamed protein product [Acanthoscelides obtectus]CAK1658629.1 hypothetical protein AOBTE_LOCUS21035 [Acanthoscelides obtectus]
MLASKPIQYHITDLTLKQRRRELVPRSSTPVGGRGNRLSWTLSGPVGCTISKPALATSLGLISDRLEETWIV